MKKIVLIRDCLLTDEQVKMFDFVKDYDAELVVVDHHRDYTDEELTEAFITFETKGPDALPENPAVTEAAKDANILITYFSEIHTKALETASKLEGICVLRSGVENVNHDYTSEHQIPVVNVPGRLAVLVSEYTIGMILAETRNIARGHAALMNGEWKSTFANSEYSVVLKNKNIGLVGLGAIGSRVAKVMKAMEANVLVYDPYVSKEKIEAEGYESVSLNEVFERSDVISVHYRLTPETRGMIGAEQIGKMKPHAYLINTARAGLIEEDALVDALLNHRIGGAALDVFWEEPLASDAPLLKADNVTLTPHIAGVSSDEFQVTFDIMKEALEKYLKEGTWIHVVK